MTSSPMTAPAEIVHLVELFKSNYDQYRSPAFTEAAVRLQFIDPFFAALGWDMYNTQEFSERYKEVVHEDKVKVSGATKAPDYGFRLGPARVFFVEAKKPAVDIQHDVEPAYQLRRYAWSAKLPLSILTDFEQLSVYDCRSKPAATDKASAGRILLLNYQEYPNRWDEIASVFSKAAVQRGALDKFAEARAGKRGTAEVDDEFLAEIERWRELLARNLALRNPALRGRDLNWAVQQIIDRIVFLRICEARDLETFEQLRALLNGGQTYERLQDLFRRADMRYNSGLFHFEHEKDRAEAPDTLTPGLAVDDKVLKDIIEHLYYPQSPYEFSVLPADILGHVYERFLGKVIRLTPGRQVKVEEKPEVRKAGGVFYTPTYIVDYIVRQTVGPLVDGKTPAQVGGAGRRPSTASALRAASAQDAAQPLRLLDPACGSGSFLLRAYQFLLDWHLQEYLKDPERWLKGKRPPLERVSSANGGGYRLSIEERKRILMNNIYGVDIDPQAVEVTKLSLLLKVLEGEGVAAQMSFLPERVLPDLGRNIKCGNSLIGTDFYAGKLDLPDEETVRRVNAFDWTAEFADAMAAGGFDAVIGNPPYIRIQALQEWAPLEVEHYKAAYRAASKGNYDIYVVFVEKGLQLLNARGRLGFILPNKFLTTDYGRPIRKLISSGRSLHALVDFGHNQVFEQATTYTCLLFLARQPNDSFMFARADASSSSLTSLALSRWLAADTLTQDSWVFKQEAATGLYEKMAGRSVPLLELPADMSRGSSSGDDDVFMLRLTEEPGVYLAIDGEIVSLEEGVLRCPVFATDFGRYRFNPRSGKVIIFPYRVATDKAELLGEEELRGMYPKAFKYLSSRRRILEKRKQFKSWYSYSAPRNLVLHDVAELVVPLLADRGLFAELPEAQQQFCLMAGGGFSISLRNARGLHRRYVLGLLNSRPLFWRLNSISNKFRGGWITCTKQYVGTLPIRTIDFADPADVARHDRMVALVTQMLDLHKRLAAEGAPPEKAALQRRIEMTDRQIDALVYELYGLTEEEVKVVEGTE